MRSVGPVDLEEEATAPDEGITPREGKVLPIVGHRPRLNHVHLRQRSHPT
jgi:hypothetical protein